MNILAFDTSTEILSVACLTGSSTVEVRRDADLKHAERLFELIDYVVSRSLGGIETVDCLAVAAGPGSFTGLRIGFAAARGLAAAGGTPIAAVPTMELYGRSLAGAGLTVMPVINAGKGRYFSALFEDGLRASADLDLNLAELVELAASRGPLVLTGPQAAEVAEKLAGAADCRLDHMHRDGRAACLARLGLELHARGIHVGPLDGPSYLRASEAEITRGKNGGRPV